MEGDAGRGNGSAKRARIVCVRCHERKVRCDLQTPDGACTCCCRAGVICKFRPSQKGHHRKTAGARHRENQAIIASSSLPSTTADWAEKRVTSLRQEIPKVDDYLRALLGHQAKLHQRSLGNDFDETMTPNLLSQADETFPPGVLRTYLDTYSDLLYSWCPVIDINTSSLKTESSLLDHSIASLAGLVKPISILDRNMHRRHYERARHLFYNERGLDIMVLIRAAMLLSCYDNSGVRSSLDSSFYWLGVAIRLAQDGRIHRFSAHERNVEGLALRRRIWWTLFGRERIMALYQGRAYVIAVEDCTIGKPRESDFPTSQSRTALIFVHWVNLCIIMGDIQKHMLVSRRNRVRIPLREMTESLIDWIQALPPHLHLPIDTLHTIQFDCDVHVLFLLYLTTSTLIGLNTAGQDHETISAAAVLSSSCIARLARDILLRGLMHTLPEDCAWSFAIAIIALLHVPASSSMASLAQADIQILSTSLESMSISWTSAKLLHTGLKKVLDESREAGDDEDHTHKDCEDQNPSSLDNAAGLRPMSPSEGIRWTLIFPFATKDTSSLLATLLPKIQEVDFDSWWAAVDFSEELNTLLGGFDVDQTPFLTSTNADT